MNVLVQTVSLIGAALILLAFIGLQRGWWAAADRRYLWYNLFGAALLTAVAVWDRRVGFVVLEGVWSIVSAASLIRPPRPAA